MKERGRKKKRERNTERERKKEDGEKKRNKNGKECILRRKEMLHQVFIDEGERRTRIDS